MASFSTRTPPISTDPGIMAGEHTHFLGDTSVPANRQFASSGGPGYTDDVNIADSTNELRADVYMVPSFQGMSGQGDNQSTDRPMGSI